METLSLKYQVMSKYTSFLCINKNDPDSKPTEELKQVQIAKKVEEEDQILHQFKLLAFRPPIIVGSSGSFWPFARKASPPRV
jgi:hypothetical protein